MCEDQTKASKNRLDMHTCPPAFRKQQKVKLLMKPMPVRLCNNNTDTVTNRILCLEIVLQYFVTISILLVCRRVASSRNKPAVVIILNCASEFSKTTFYFLSQSMMEK